MTAAATKPTAVHPFAPLSADEITNAAALVKGEWPANTDVHFKAITLEEPPKAETLPFLDAEHKGQTVPAPDRKAFVMYYLRRTNKFHEAIVNLSHQKIERNVRLGVNMHSPGDGEEILAIEKVVLADAGVQAAIAKLKLPADTVVIVDPWIYGTDGIDDDERLYQCFMYMRDPANPTEENSNHYAHPLPISPVVNTERMIVTRIDIMPTGADHTVKELEPATIHPASEYMPKYQTLRTDLKPLQVVQPEGASFTVTTTGTSSVIEWQKWHFRFGYNQREGMVIYNVRYDGRDLFYRMSLSDVNIPYGDPRHPFHKKSAFDLGDAGAGFTANNLALGCDCLGAIHYLSAVLSDDKGGPLHMPNVVCIHEQDAGIGWKHTNYRTNVAAVTRQRELVVQSIITVSNYEYIFAFTFNQAGELHYETRATGILSTQPIDAGVSVPWGTVVHPGVLATHHQHVFSLRVDPAIDGHANRLVYSEAHAMPLDATSNPHGNGYTVAETVLDTAGGYDINPDTSRTFTIQNASIRNAINNKPVGYKILAPSFQKILSHPSSFNHRRAEFADHNIYALRYHDDQLYAGGKYTNQSRGGEGVRTWAAQKEAILDTDLVLFIQFGMNHVPRVEDFPVMPCEILRVGFKPVNFFQHCPSLDVPPAVQAFNQSVLVGGQGRPDAACCATNGTNGGTNGTNGVNGHH